VVGVAQVMVVRDTTLVNIALPSAQRGGIFSNDDRQWVVTAYALAFGSLLPLGARIPRQRGWTPPVSRPRSPRYLWATRLQHVRRAQRLARDRSTAVQAHATCG
jgi:hypothetical protein